MKKSLTQLLEKYRELAAFFMVGLVVTATNWITYSVLVTVLDLGIHISNIISWFVAVIVAFFLNKTLVFRSKDWSFHGALSEGILFFGSRILSGVVEIGLVPILMALGITWDVLGVKGFAAKFFAGAVATVMSYFLSKYGVFKKAPAQADSSEHVHIEYHADDYGLFPAQSELILDCHRNGVLNAVSVMTNSPYLAACMEQLRPCQQNISLAVHLNFMEGKCLSPKEDVPLLTDAAGNFNTSFGKLLLRSYLPGRRALRAQLRQEIRAQILALAPYMPAGAAWRLDGHAHYHMVPVVFDSMMDVIREEGLDVSYIRIPREYPSIYLKNRRALSGFRPINLVKVLILNILAVRNCRKYRSFSAHWEHRLFLGVFFSGRMTEENVRAVLPEATRKAKKAGQGLELLAHPGGVYRTEDIAQLTNQDDVSFLTSDFRKREAAMFQSIC